MEWASAKCERRLKKGGIGLALKVPLVSWHLGEDLSTRQVNSHPRAEAGHNQQGYGAGDKGLEQNNASFDFLPQNTGDIEGALEAWLHENQFGMP